MDQNFWKVEMNDNFQISAKGLDENPQLCQISKGKEDGIENSSSESSTDVIQNMTG
jgi:hypothetical protein